MKAIFLLPICSIVVGAYPSYLLEKRELPLSEAEGNCGPLGCTTFDATEQLIDVSSGSGHEFQVPGLGDKRGPCPGLNAAANHGFIPRNGILNIQQTISGLGKAFGMSTELAALLAVIGIVWGGDPVAQTWSIGGQYQPSALGALVAKGYGITNTHNSAEADASPTRFDAFLNNGNPAPLDLRKWNALFARANAQGEYTPDILRDHNKWVFEDSVSRNPYFFAGFIPAGAHQFIINFFSNHSAERPNGFLSSEVLKSFLAISGTSPSNFVYNKGQERIPYNWYRRPTINSYGVEDLGLDLAIMATKYPEALSIGGNTGTVNSFTGINIGDLTGGVYNAQTLFQGNNLACFFFQQMQLFIPNILNGILGTLLNPLLVGPLQSLLDQFNGYMNPVLGRLTCPQLASLNKDVFNPFPGFYYKPSLFPKRN